jgi:hypothetical protein
LYCFFDFFFNAGIEYTTVLNILLILSRVSRKVLKKELPHQLMTKQ